jgi:hypothetical protein
MPGMVDTYTPQAVDKKNRERQNYKANLHSQQDVQAV